jgi:hypothetical protein
VSPVRPVRRRVILALLVFNAVLLLAIVQGVDLLRHPLPGGEDVDEVDEPTGDPRVAVDCDGVPPPGSLVTSNDLLDCPDRYHGQEVAYEGEVVGAVLRRPDGAWVQLNDDVYAALDVPVAAHRDYQGGNAGVGVLIPHDVADQVARVGGPHDHGDIIAVRGIFQRIDAVHREAAVILASEGRVVRRGTAIDDPILLDRAIAASVLGLLAAGIAIAERIATWRRRRVL